MNQPEKEAQVFKALSDPNRLRILEILTGGEQCACKILEELNISQPTLSHHMKILCDAGLTTCKRSGKWCHYTLDPEGIQTVSLWLNRMSRPVPRRACCERAVI